MTLSIPRLNDSIPKFPLPPNKSRAIPPSKYGPIILKILSFTLSVVGRVFVPFTALMLLPFNVPATTRSLSLPNIFLFYLIIKM